MSIVSTSITATAGLPRFTKHELHKGQRVDQVGFSIRSPSALVHCGPFRVLGTGSSHERR